MWLIAIATWVDRFHDGIGKLVVVGDAQGVLQAAMKGRSKWPKLNEVIAEMQLKLARTRFDITAVHIWSEKNDMCDQLSRLSEGARLPAACRRWREWPRKGQERWKVLGRG